MPPYFKPLRRKLGVVTLVVALMFMMPWIRNQFVNDDLRIYLGQNEFSLQSAGGAIQLRCYWPVAGYSDRPNESSWSEFKKDSWQLGRTLIGGERGKRWVQISPATAFGKDPSAEQDYVVVWAEYRLLIVPLSLLSAWLLLSKPRVANPAAIGQK